MKKAALLLLGTGLSLLSSEALAQAQWQGSYSPSMPTRSSSIDNLGEEMQFVFGVDRVMGVSWDRATISPDVGGEITQKATTVALFGSAAGGDVPTTNIPRLALDFFVTEGISIGGSFIFISKSGESETDAGSSDLDSNTTWAIHPRVGYAYPFDETLSIWPRAGITYFSSSTELAAGGEANASGFDLTGEVMLGISPMSHFAILVGPYLDLGLSGTVENVPATGPSTESDATLTSFGLAVSVVGYY